MSGAKRTLHYFVVPGRPQGKGSKRVLPIRSKRRQGGVVLVDSNRNAAPWEARIAAAASAEFGERELIRGPVAVRVSFFFARPKGHYRTGRNAGLLRDTAPRFMATLPDVDKLVRCALDALSGIVIHDDTQVIELHARKLYGEPEQAVFTIEEA